MMEYNDNHSSPLFWTEEKREATLEALPSGVGWYACDCGNTETFCEHYLGMGMPYWLCGKHTEGYYPQEDGPIPQPDRKCEHCVKASGLYY